jgi:hypothetical protein
MKTVAFLLACVSLFGQTKPAEKSALDKVTLEAYLRHVELWVPQVAVKIDDAKPAADMPGFFAVTVHLSFNGGKKDEHYFVSKDGHKIVKGDVYDVNKNPFQGNLDKLKTEGQPSYGAANAPVTLVVFSDFQCPVCKEEAQVLRQNISKSFPDKVRVAFKDFPLDSIHPWAHTAAIAGRCVFKQNPAKFWDYFDWVYENQQSIGLDNFNTKFQEFATAQSLDGMQLGRCVDNKTTDAGGGDAYAVPERTETGRRDPVGDARATDQHRAGSSNEGGRGCRKVLRSYHSQNCEVIECENFSG